MENRVGHPTDNSKVAQLISSPTKISVSQDRRFVNMFSKKVAIIGGALSMPHPQHSLPETQIWTTGRLINDIPFADVAFDFHFREWEDKYDAEKVYKYLEGLKEFQGDIIGFNSDAYDFNVEEYPFEEVADYGMCGNSICYMLAYAIRIGVTDIDLYCMPHSGVDEYLFEKPNVLYWIGQCEGSGIKVNDYSDLLKRDLFYMGGK